MNSLVHVAKNQFVADLAIFEAIHNNMDVKLGFLLYLNTQQ